VDARYDLVCQTSADWKRIMKSRGFGLLVVFAVVVVSCAGSESSESSGDDTSSLSGGDASVIALGDSIFEWNSDQSDSIPEVIGRALGVPILNAARSGAHFSNSDSAAAPGLDIRNQYQGGDWEWVVIVGGGNDYRDDCGCGECDAQIDELLSADGMSGEIPDFVRDLITGDTRVMLVGYYEVPSDADFGFDLCWDEVIEHNTRLALMAGATDRVWFVSAGDVVSANDRTAYAADRVHPSVAGSKLVGEHIAAAMLSIGPS
jgi:acyl-CoA thioesterase-1